jgi:hypothetical protein
MDDATPLQQMNAETAAAAAYLFDIRAGLRFTSMFTRYGRGDKIFTGPNPPAGALITYCLNEKPAQDRKLKLEILDATGKVIREIKNPPSEKGINRAAWDLSYEAAKPRRAATDEGGSFFGAPRGPKALPGSYTVRLTLGDQKIEKRVEVRMDPLVKVDAADLRALFDLSMKLREMISAVNQSLRALDSLKDQLQQMEKTARDRMPDSSTEASKTIGEYVKQIEALQEKLARKDEPSLGLGGSPRLSDNLGNLFFTIEGVNAAPTAAQRENFDELAAEVPLRISEVNRFITESVSRINEALKKQGLPALIAGKPIEMPN